MNSGTNMKKEKLADVEIEIDSVTFMKVAFLAHEKDITFNKMCNNLISDYIKENKKDTP